MEMRQLRYLVALADEQHFRVVFPNSVSGNWNDGRVFDGAATADDIGFVDAILAHFASTTDATRIVRGRTADPVALVMSKGWDTREVRASSSRRITQGDRKRPEQASRS